jgi:predicted CoA-binding protein
MANTKQIAVLFATDANHNRNSYRVVGIFESKERAIKAIIPTLQNVANEDYEDMGYEAAEDLVCDFIDNLHQLQQTQTLNENYVIETRLLNEINL